MKYLWSIHIDLLNYFNETDLTEIYYKKIKNDKVNEIHVQ